MKKIICAVLFFILFLNASAQFTYQWANSAGSSGTEYGEAIATDVTGNVYVTGVFTGTVDFDPDPLVTVNLIASSKDIFLAKYNANGNLIFAKRIGGSDDEAPNDIHVNANGVYIVGKFLGTCDFDPSTSNSLISCNGGGVDGDGFVAKYDLNGNYQWVIRIGGAGNDQVLGITEDSSGNIVVSGFFSNTVDFDPGTSTVNYTSTSYNTFFAKYTSAGNYVFAKQLPGDYNDANDIQLDASDNIYIGGSFSETVDFDPGVGSATMSTSGIVQIDAFFAKYSSTGIYIWAKRIGGNSTDFINQIAVNASNIVVGGIFSTTCDFDPTVSTANLTSAGQGDLFFAKYDLAGGYQFAYGIGGTTNDRLNGLVIDAANNIFIAGNFNGTTINFNPAGVGTGSSLLTGNNTGYIAQYTSNGNFIAANSIGSTTSEVKGIYIANASVYYTGSFTGTVDFDFSSGGTANLTSIGNDDIFVSKLNYSGTTSTPAVENENKITIYPNPNNGIFSVKAATGEIQIYNSLGEIIYQAQKQSNNNFLIDLSNQGSGVYFMIINTEDKRAQQKIVIR